MSIYFNVINPISQKIITKVKDYNQREVSKELKKIFKSTTKFTTHQKLKIINNFTKRLQRKNISEDFINTIVNEVGVSQQDAKFEFDRLLATVKSCSKIIQYKTDDVTNEYQKFETKRINYDVLRKPLKLGLGITPFNLPLI